MLTAALAAIIGFSCACGPPTTPHTVGALSDDSLTVLERLALKATARDRMFFPWLADRVLEEQLARLEERRTLAEIERCAIELPPWGLEDLERSIDTLGRLMHSADLLAEGDPETSDLYTELADFAERLLGAIVLHAGTHVARDDAVDALAAALTGLAPGPLQTIPESPGRDAAGIPMEMVFAG